MGLEFSSFEVERHPSCNYDTVRVYDGTYHGNDDNLLAKLCGSDIPADLRSTRNKMTVIFVSDDRSQREGFQAHFRTLYQDEGTEEAFQQSKSICGGL